MGLPGLMGKEGKKVKKEQGSLVKPRAVMAILVQNYQLKVTVKGISGTWRQKARSLRIKHGHASHCNEVRLNSYWILLVTHESQITLFTLSANVIHFCGFGFQLNEQENAPDVLPLHCSPSQWF